MSTNDGSLAMNKPDDSMFDEEEREDETRRQSLSGVAPIRDLELSEFDENDEHVENGAHYQRIGEYMGMGAGDDDTAEETADGRCSKHPSVHTREMQMACCFGGFGVIHVPCKYCIAEASLNEWVKEQSASTTKTQTDDNNKKGVQFAGVFNTSNKGAKCALENIESDEIFTKTFSSGPSAGEYFGEVKRHGLGKMVYSSEEKSGEVYIGEWVNGVKEGAGKYTYKDGGVYNGSWKKDVPDGMGKKMYGPDAIRNRALYVNE